MRNYVNFPSMLSPARSIPKVKDKVMLILVDSGSSHSFISSQFGDVSKLHIVPMSPKKVKLANGEWIVTDKIVPKLECYCQGQTYIHHMLC